MTDSDIKNRVQHLLKACADRTGTYAEEYRLGLEVASTPLAPYVGLGQGYRDGLALRPYRVRVRGAGAVARTAEAMRAYRARKKLKSQSQGV